MALILQYHKSPKCDRLCDDLQPAHACPLSGGHCNANDVRQLNRQKNTLTSLYLLFPNPINFVP